MNDFHNSKKNNAAALYLRLSKEDVYKIQGGDESQSIQNQRLLLMEEAAKRGFTVTDIYCDEDYSGTDESRPEFNRLLKDAYEKRFSVILCKSQSRFTRDMEVSERYINRIFPLLKIRFISIADHVDTDKRANKRARQINALVNEWYVEDLSENIKSVLKSKMRQGQFLGAFAPYGYKKDENDNHKLVIDAEAAAVVKSIFDYCMQGYGIQQICYQLQQQNILPPTAYKQSKGLAFQNPNAQKQHQKNALWARTTIKRILTNEVYIGTLIQGREKKISYKSKKVVTAPKNEWIVVEKNHEAIISKEDFYNVQEILQLKRRFSPIPDKKNKHYPLAGKVKCKDCGSTMIRRGSQNTKYYYLSCGLAGKSSPKQCTSHMIKYSILEQKVAEALQCHIKNSENSICDRKKEIPLLPIHMEQKKESTGLKHNREVCDLHQNAALQHKKTVEDNENILQAAASKQTIKKYGPFAELTNELVYAFIDFIEIGEKNENGCQYMTIYWKC